MKMCMSWPKSLFKYRFYLVPKWNQSTVSHISKLCDISGLEIIGQTAHFVDYFILVISHLISPLLLYFLTTFLCITSMASSYSFLIPSSLPSCSLIIRLQSIPLSLKLDNMTKHDIGIFVHISSVNILVCITTLIYM